jgi:Zn-dependent M28 family amino/carboxypeptidase/uncharacterized protein (DUF1684 family)
MRRLLVLSLLFPIATACGGAGSESDPPASRAARRVPIAELPQIEVPSLLAHTKMLASDQFEGRAPGSPGEELTVDYLVEQFKSIGLQPGNGDGTFIQKVPLVGITASPTTMVLRKGANERRLKWKDDIVAWTKHVEPTAALRDSELVFVGYGIVAPEFNWDDYKGVDVRGKTLVMLVNDPPIRNPNQPAELDAKMFGGIAMTYYGRWTYKFEMAAQKGAAGAIIIHDTEPAGYPFDVVQSSWEGEQFDLVTPDQNRQRASIEAWMSNEQGRSLAAWAGQNLDNLQRQAMTREFKPVPFGIQASITIRNQLRTISSRNVVAKLEGADPRLKDEYVVYTAHWDHLGRGPAVNGDEIYNGAKDNAVGTAGLLEIARAFTRLEEPPSRSILFLAVTAEEQGLLGSAYYALSPLAPLTKTLANINMDGLNVYGRTKDVTLIGHGASDLDDYIRDAATEQGRVIRPDAEPEKGYYYRSDHFSFAKRGVPALNPDEGIDFIGKPESYGQRVREEYTDKHYHKPSDDVKADWDLEGAREDLQLFFAVGYRVANAGAFPEWKPGQEFRAIREQMLKHAGDVEKWRSQHEADYSREYVPLAGLHYLKDGANTIGSDANSDVVLPSGTPPTVGRMILQGGDVTFEPATGAQVRLNDRVVTSPTRLKADEERLVLGDISFWVHASGARRAVRVRDPNGATARSFAGYRWFPIDDRYRAVGRFVKDPAPRELKVASLSGDDQTYQTEGVVNFVLNGEPVRLRPMTTAPNRFFFVFRDATSGKETYEAARFLYADLQPDGSVVLDFNMAYNPPCAFNPYTTCPLPLPENRLKISIPAGERAYAGHK